MIAKTTFADLPPGSRFRWVNPPVWNGDYLSYIYVKVGDNQFGHTADWAPWIVTNEMTWPVTIETAVNQPKEPT